jgi:hypothetical protein
MSSLDVPGQEQLAARKAEHVSVALVSTPAVRWLIENEPDLHRRVLNYIAGYAPEVAEVAGPPSAKEIVHFMKRRDATRHDARLRLPLVTLFMSWTENPDTGERGIKVTCSDPDLNEIIKWAREDNVRKTLARQPQMRG